MIRLLLALAAAVFALAPARAQDDSFSHLYRPADGWAGDAIVHDIRRPATPACLMEDDLDELQYALDDGDALRAQSMADVCVMLPNASWGTILGATPSGGGYFRMHMTYVHKFPGLAGIEVFVPVASLRDIGEPKEALWDQYHKILGQ